MDRYGLSEKERAVIQQLLAEKGIFLYEIASAVHEGKSLPGSCHDSKISSVSGAIVTPLTAYCFWLDWVDGHYTLGDAKGENYWSEISPGSSGLSNVAEIQQRLRNYSGSVM